MGVAPSYFVNKPQFVQGKSLTVATLNNGQIGVVGEITLPNTGWWIFFVSGWRPGDTGNGSYVALIQNGSTICASDAGEFQFSMSGGRYFSNLNKLTLELTNWTGKTLSNVNIGGLIFNAIQIA